MVREVMKKLTLYYEHKCGSLCPVNGSFSEFPVFPHDDMYKELAFRCVHTDRLLVFHGRKVGGSHG